MSDLKELQHEFLNYLLQKPSSITNNIISDQQLSAQGRLDMYAHGYRLRLKEAIETDYEQLHAYLGDETFDRLMDHYIDLTLSHHPSLRYYSQGLPTHLAEIEPWKETPELAEIASIEKAFCDSFDSADCIAASVQDLSEIDPNSWPNLKVKFHDSVQLLTLEYNSFQIWQALSDEEVPPTRAKDSTTWLIWRSDLISNYVALAEAELSALNTMLAGGDFSALCEVLLDHYEESETPQQAVFLLQEWLSSQMICNIAITND